ncbi:nascent polypeptide-associated complex domain-containing protein [Phakopsora pachyrhizi]|nr:nascent polypeptide-associated complex domain-containing protein [Phakopsora pachyrhizi]
MLLQSLKNNLKKISEIFDETNEIDSKLSNVKLNEGEDLDLAVGEDNEDVDHEIENGLDTLQSRGERKARKALAKLGLKRVSGISRVTMRRFKTQHFFVIANAEVYKSPHSNCYIVFGEARTEDAAAGLSNLASGGGFSKNASNPSFQSDMMMANSSAAGKQVANKIEDDDDDGPVDETGVDPADIEMLLGQVNCSRAKAVRALKSSDGDLINAIIAAS